MIVTSLTCPMCGRSFPALVVRSLCYECRAKDVEEEMLALSLRDHECRCGIPQGFEGPVGEFDLELNEHRALGREYRRDLARRAAA